MYAIGTGTDLVFFCNQLFYTVLFIPIFHSVERVSDYSQAIVGACDFDVVEHSQVFFFGFL